MPPKETIVLRPSPLKWLGIGLICIIFVIIGIWQIRIGEKMGWICLLFFGLGCAVTIASLLPNATYLRLTPEGFTMCSMYRAHTFRWQDVTEFEVGQVFTNKMVLFNFTPGYDRSARLRSLNVGLVGYEAGLPDSYGLKHKDLADLLNEYKSLSNSY